MKNPSYEFIRFDLKLFSFWRIYDNNIHFILNIIVFQLEYLLFRSLLTAYDKVEILDENLFNGFAFNIILGAYGVKISSFEIEDCPNLK